MWCSDVDIVVLADISGSVSGHEAFIYSAVEEFADLHHSAGARVSIAVFSYSTYVANGLDEDPVVPGYPAQTTTNMANAIETAANVLFSSAPDRRKFIVLITDGAPDSEARAFDAAKAAKSVGVSILGVGIATEEANLGFLEAISDIYVASNYKLLAEELKKLSICL